jgi:hypothetical protein
MKSGMEEMDGEMLKEDVEPKQYRILNRLSHIYKDA